MLLCKAVDIFIHGDASVECRPGERWQVGDSGIRWQYRRRSRPFWEVPTRKSRELRGWALWRRRIHEVLALRPLYWEPSVSPVKPELSTLVYGNGLWVRDHFLGSVRYGRRTENWNFKTNWFKNMSTVISCLWRNDDRYFLKRLPLLSPITWGLLNLLVTPQKLDKLMLIVYRALKN